MDNLKEITEYTALTDDLNTIDKLIESTKNSIQEAKANILLHEEKLTLILNQIEHAQSDVSKIKCNIASTGSTAQRDLF